MGRVHLPIRIGRKLDRSRPSVLSPHLSQSQWDALADDYDAIVVPNHQVLYSVLCALPVLGLLMTAYGGFRSIKHNSTSTREPKRWEDDDGRHPFIFIGPPLLLISGILLAVISGKRNKKFLEDFQAFCARQEHPQLTFHMSTEHSTSRDSDGHSHPNPNPNYYWDIATKDDLEGALQNVMQAMGMGGGGGVPFTSFATNTGGGTTFTSTNGGTAFTSNGGTTNTSSHASYSSPPTYPHRASKPATPVEAVIVVDATPGTLSTVRQRLEELDRLRDLISEEEYQRKRKDILDSV
jgi:hypothetical protein